MLDEIRVGLFDRIVLIYNPVNRRVPLTLAESLRSELGRRLPDVPVVLQATQRAGHARELAGDAAATGRPLIIAVSGDGVYNEIVNGVLDAAITEALAAVAAGGNANDHRRSTRRMPLVDAIVAARASGRPRRLDLLRLTVRSAEGEWSHYAHSYIRFGLTPSMAVGLRRDRKGTIAELLSVLRTFGTLTPVEVVRSGGRRERYDSLVFANVARMAKYGRLSRFGRPDDGLFEVMARRHGRRDGAIPDVAEAVAGVGPREVSQDWARAQHLLDLVSKVPAPTGGRDESRAGEMWNSNSITSWLPARSGCDTGAVAPPTWPRAGLGRRGLRSQPRPVGMASPDVEGPRLASGEPGVEAAAEHAVGADADLLVVWAALSVAAALLSMTACVVAPDCD